MLSPLNGLVGTEANVRLLRVLSLAASPLAASELAKRAELGRTSVYPALAALERAGIVEFTGAGAQRHVQFRGAHPLARPLRDLYAAEARRFESLVEELRGIFAAMPSRPIAAWMEYASEGVGADETLQLHLVAAADQLQPMTDRLLAALSELERRHDVQITVRGLTRSEMSRLATDIAIRLRDAVLLDGVPPLTLVGATKRDRKTASSRTHHQQDARARRLALAVATKLKWDPGLLVEAQHQVARRLQHAGAGERRELQEWSRILSTMSAARLRRFLVEDSERATRLRQTLPALDVLTDAERAAVVACSSDAEVLKLVGGR